MTEYQRESQVLFIRSARAQPLKTTFQDLSTDYDICDETTEGATFLEIARDVIFT